MNNKVVVGLIVVILGVVAGWYVLGGKANMGSLLNTTQIQQSPTPEAGLNTVPVTREAPVEGTDKGGAVTGNTVSYTDTGFTPNILTVPVGTAVTFTNTSTKSMWVASAMHPTHQVLPGFDELTSVSSGGTYAYTFVKVGTWKYHNHTSPGDTGTVIVTQ